MDGSLSSSVDGFSFVNIPEKPGENDDSEYDFANSLIVRSTDFSIVNGTESKEPNNDIADTFANVNHWLLVELKSEQNRNRSLLESYNKLKSDFDEFKTNSVTVEKLSVTSFDDAEPKTLTSVNTEVARDIRGSTKNEGDIDSEKTMATSIKEEHLVELTNYLQSELTLCKKEMYAMNSRMVDVMKSLKEKKQNLSTAETQTENNATHNDEVGFSMISSSLLPNNAREFSSIETQTDAGEEASNTFSLVSEASSEPKTLQTEKEDSNESLQTWFSSTFSFDRREGESEVEEGQLYVRSIAPALVSDDTPSNEHLSLPASNTTNNRSLDAKTCPICNREFADVDEREMQLHVNEHLDKDDRKCPMCSLKFDGVSQSFFELHVYSHFGQLMAESFNAHSLFE